ncbi:MAG: DUF2461 domain-containing protein [Prolixibacteraceae bacterium]|jgi:uncharacterized protein (TIGR02453 family)|nr:DUF2461 domain-containing protein [Prolixibacteraceae bacterium]
MKDILQFLKELDLNNERAWFDANRSRYEKTKKDFLDITASFIDEIRKFDVEVPLLQPKDCMFRIFRDVRFSNDKRPFKTNYGSYIARGGRKSGFAGYYIHVQPGEYFISGGVYMPLPEHLAAIRQEIYYHTDEYRQIIEKEPFQSTFDQHYFDPLKTAPKGFPKDWEHISLIKNRSFGFGKSLTEKELLADDFIEKSAQIFRLLLPVNHFFNRAIEDSGKD